MKNLCKAGIMLALSVVVLFFSSCAEQLGGAIDNLAGNGGLTEAEEKASRISDELFEGLANHDKEKLKELFCNATKTSDKFDRQLDDAMTFFKGDKYVRCGMREPSSVEKSVAYGKVTDYAYFQEIGYVEFEYEGASIYYSVCYYNCIMSSENDALVGLQNLTITLLNGDSIEIGE